MYLNKITPFMLVIYCLLIGVEPKDHRRVHHLRCSPRGGFERIADVASKSRRRFERRYISRSRKPRDVSLRNLPAAPYFSTRPYRDVSHGSLDIGPPPLSRMYLLAATWPPRIFSFPFDPISQIFHPPIERKGVRCNRPSLSSFLSRFLLFLLRSLAILEQMFTIVLCRRAMKIGIRKKIVGRRW